jgi:hypothetical protein
LDDFTERPAAFMSLKEAAPVHGMRRSTVMEVPNLRIRIGAKIRRREVAELG